MIVAIPDKEDAISELQIAIITTDNVKWYRRLTIIQRSMAGMAVPLDIESHF
jgi:hypothetical protein